MSTNQALVEAIYQMITGGVVPDSSARGAFSLGIRVNRSAAADANGATDIFTIAGGMILLTSLFGVRTVIQGGGASNINFNFDVGPTDLCIATATTATDAVGTTYSLAGDLTDALIIGAGTGVANTVVPTEPAKLVATSLQYGSIPLFLLGVGNITVTFSAAAPTGSTRYVMTYIPLDDAVTVVAA